MFDYVHNPTHMQNTVAENGGWGGHMGEVVPSRAFLIFNFGDDSFNASTAYPEKRGFFAQCTQKCVLVVGILYFFGVGLPRGSNLPPLPQKPLFNGPNKAIILHGSE